MAKRKRIGIIHLDWGTSWTGGYYYIINLINALNTLPSNKKPIVSIFCEKKSQFEDIQKETQYQLLNYLPINIEVSRFAAIINRISRKLFGVELIKTNYTGNEVDIIFPYQQHIPSLEVFSRSRIYWIPDFQERYLPDFFPKEDIEARKAYQLALATRKEHVLFSSCNAMNDFKKFYPDYKCSLHVLNFAVTHPQYSCLPIQQLKEKYKIEGPYFISPNQFWAHKNHIVILEAIRVLKEEGLNFTVVFSGKENDSRNPNYCQELLDFVNKYGLTPYVKFVGFINRSDLLQLMTHALAVIQPSLFEGWSTVVEDAKAMNQYVLLSDLPVHREQMNYNVSFFNPRRPHELANLIRRILHGEQPVREKVDYSIRIQTFATDFMTIAKKVCDLK